MRISYTVDTTISNQNMCEIVLNVDDFPDETMNVTIPAWVPGSYTIRDYSGSIRDFRASTVTGEPLPVRKKDKGTWTVSKTRDQFVRIKYRVYSGELIPQRSHIDDFHTYLLGASTFVYLDGYREQSCEIEFKVPEHSELITSLEETGKNHFRATQYDVLADSVTEIGHPRTSRFSVEGKDHLVVFCGYDEVDLEKVTADIKKIVETVRDLFQYLPYKNYTFFFHVTENGSGSGHEHSSSCSIVIGKSTFEEQKYTNFLNVVAHEFFHAYNVKRIRPTEFEKFNYREENYTSLLWFSEGFTSYYAEIILARAGLIDEKTYFERLAESIRLYEIMPGRLVISASSSSFDAWIRLYKSSTDDVNTYISYYTKGELIAVLMNVRILQYTASQKSLDDLMRLLWERFRKDGKGFAEKDLISSLREVTGNDFTPFFEKYVNGTESIDFESELGALGYSVSKTRFGENNGKNGRKTAGILMRNEGGKFRVVTPLAGYPSFGSGISPGDEMLSYDNLPFNVESFAPVTKKWPSVPGFDYLKGVKDGQKTLIRILRRGKIREYSIEVSDPPFEQYSVTKMEGEKYRKYVEKYING